MPFFAQFRTDVGGWFKALLPMVFLVGMVLLPLLAMLHQSDGQMMWSVWQDAYIQQRIAWTIWQAAITAVMVVLLGVPMAWVLARYDFWGRQWLLRLLMLPFVMPTLVAGMGVLALFGEQGLLWRGWADTPYLLLYGNVFFNLPVLVRAAYQAFAKFQPHVFMPLKLWVRLFGNDFFRWSGPCCGRGWLEALAWYFCIVFPVSVWLYCWGVNVMPQWKWLFIN